MTLSRRRVYAGWIVLIVCFAVLHLFCLRADFPNHSPWFADSAKYTDEGWWANAAVHAHLTGNWYIPGDYAPAPAAPVLPALEWVLFFFTGVTVQAARGLVVTLFILSLFLTCLLLRDRIRVWAVLMALTMLVTSPFIYSFSRLALLELPLIVLTLAALNLAVRLPRSRHAAWASAGLGLIFSLMMLTKPTAIFLLPALAWACLQPLRNKRRLAFSCCLAALGGFLATYGLWMALLLHNGQLRNYLYLFKMNGIPRKEMIWPLIAFLKVCYTGLKIDHILVPLAVLFALWALISRKHNWARTLWLDPVFGASALVAAGYIAFMIDHDASPRYFVVLAFFLFLALAQGTEMLLRGTGWPKRLGWLGVALVTVGVCSNSITTLSYALHPQYTFVNAAEDLTRYIDGHPNGNRILVSSSGDDLTLMTHIPTLCDPWGTQDYASKLATYQPGWFAGWNQLDTSDLEAIHRGFSLEQVASFHVLDNPDRNLLVLFKLRPLAPGRLTEVRDLKLPLPEDRIEIPVVTLATIKRERTRQKLFRELRGVLHIAAH